MQKIKRQVKIFLIKKSKVQKGNKNKTCCNLRNERNEHWYYTLRM